MLEIVVCNERFFRASSGSWRVGVVRLRSQESSPGGEDQSDNECPIPAHLVVPKSPNVYVINDEIQWHTQYEQTDKTKHLVRHLCHCFAENEGCTHQNRERSDHSKDGVHIF